MSLPSVLQTEFQPASPYDIASGPEMVYDFPFTQAFLITKQALGTMQQMQYHERQQSSTLPSPAGR